MTTHRHIDKICVAVTLLGVILSLLFVNGEALGLESKAKAAGYESMLFDTSTVHSIDIIMDDWDGFIATCENEEYTPCAIVIDGQAYKNVGIRAKGNTSLSMVSELGSERYSFKIEFDQYDSTKNYYGLDKLVLNNIIQDNTYMKDYVVYQLMSQMGVPTPLCSYVYVTVNGEDWGLYLALEGIEESFLQRNYGRDYGELYKPDSTDAGGGRGNGRNFSMGDIPFGDDVEGNTSAGREETGRDFTPSSGLDGRVDPKRGGREYSRDETNAEQTEGIPPDIGSVPGEEAGAPPDSEFVPGAGAEPDFGLESRQDFNAEIPMAGDFEPSEQNRGEGTPPNFDGGNMTPPDMGEAPDFTAPGGGFGGAVENESDVKLQYIDDDPDSYPNIFDNAKTDVTSKDKKRLISSLETLSSGENIEDVVDVDEVIRYFAVHNFVCNGDSYTGNIVHNYYLYEKDGQLSMLPWDYNLAFGTFQTSNATAEVNAPIDTPVSGGTGEDRPMVSWIFDNREYTEQYHKCLAELLEKVDFESLISETAALIAPYVENDPTKFCTYAEFEAGVTALTEFCMLRAESVQGQLSGAIPSTTFGQSEASAALVDASELELADMGTMTRERNTAP